MSRWFRFYDDALNDPKVQQLSPEMFRAWVNLLCIASKNDGVLPNLEEVAFSLRMSATKAGGVVGYLASVGLLDAVEGGYFRPHNWDNRQYKSDVSTDRVKSFRQRQKKQERNVSVTPNETPPETEQNRAELERETRAREPLVSREAFDLVEDIAKSHKSDIESPAFYGFPMMAQTWLAEKIPRDFILATCARLPGKHQKYLDKAVRNSWTERQSQPDRQNGKAKSNSLTDAIDQHIQNFAGDGRNSEAREDSPRLLSHG